MHIERLRVLVNLKAGEKRWAKGSVVEAPIPSELVSEVRANTGLVEVLKPTKQPVVEEDKVDKGVITVAPYEATQLTPNILEDNNQTIPVYIFIAPEGDEVEIENIWRYSKETGMSYNGLNNLVRGRSKTHKGWTYKGLK